MSRKSGNKCLKLVKNNFHSYESKNEVASLQNDLLRWYHNNKRTLPWRDKAADVDLDLNIKAYSVWVSEIMLQQTQVATVISYYNKWMKKWPTIEHLAKASLEEVNEAWSGLGYYSRGRRLHEGAQKVMNELDKEVPRSSQELLKQLPGVGRYTSCAIASIAYNEHVSVVDGNVMRVISRLRAIGADSTSQATVEMFWSVADSIVDKKTPGDFNQAMMELGATVCTPKNPSCKTCPLQTYCHAYKQVEYIKEKNTKKLNKSSDTLIRTECDIEDCHLCLPGSGWDDELGVMNYPRKAKKKPPKEERTAVFILEAIAYDCKTKKYLITQRPEKGLLAGMWEFPSFLIDDEKDDKLQHLISDFHLPSICKPQAVGEVVHIFSHIHQTYVVQSIHLPEVPKVQFARPFRWLTEQELQGAALSTAMRKVFKAFTTKKSSTKVQPRKRKSSSTRNLSGKKQSTLEKFFKSSG